MGSEFTIVPFINQTSGYIYKVIASYENTTVLVNDQQITLHAGEVYENDILDSTVTTVVSSRPVLVVQYMKSQSVIFEDPIVHAVSIWIGPSITLVNANSQFTNQEVVFSASLYTKLYATIVVLNGDVASLTLDYMPIPSAWSQVGANSTEIVQGELGTGGLHVIQTSDQNTRFAVYVYSIGDAISHAFPASFVFGSCPKGMPHRRNNQDLKT